MPVRVACAALLSACAGGRGEARSTEGASASPCQPEPIPLAIEGGVHLYIEPEALVRVASGFVLAGSPSYTYGPGPDGTGAQRSADAYVAALFDLEGRAVPVAKPLEATIGSVRAVALDDDRWGVLFDELDPDSVERVHQPAGLWYAEHEGVGLTSLERVPLPARGRLDFSSSSELVRAGERLIWVVAARLDDGSTELLEYTRRDGGWSLEVISEDWVEVSTLAFDQGSGDLWMAHFSEDSAAPGWQQSLRLYRRSATWELVRTIAFVADGARVHDPGLTVGAGGVAVAWRVEGRDDSGAYAVLGADSATADVAPIALDSLALQLLPLPPAMGSPRWLVHHLDHSGRGAVVRWLQAGSDARAHELAAAAGVYRSGFLAGLALSRDEALVVGAEVSLDPVDPYLRSLLLRLKPSCS